MKLIYCVPAVLLALSACSTTPVDQGSLSTAPGTADSGLDIALQPLQVPSLSALPETPARALAGRYQAVNWSTLPGWQADSLDHVWKGFINNCKGLMRPVSGSLAMPARANPRAWQPVCQAAAAAGLNADTKDTAAVRSYRYVAAHGHLRYGNTLPIGRGRTHYAATMLTPPPLAQWLVDTHT